MSHSVRAWKMQKIKSRETRTTSNNPEILHGTGTIDTLFWKYFPKTGQYSYISPITFFGLICVPYIRGTENRVPVSVLVPILHTCNWKNAQILLHLGGIHSTFRVGARPAVWRYLQDADATLGDCELCTVKQMTNSGWAAKEMSGIWQVQVLWAQDLQ